MALVQCAECGAQISDKAAACPQCGAPHSAVKPPAPEPDVVQQNLAKRSSGCVTIIFGGILALLFIGWLASESEEDRAAQAQQAERERVAAMTPEQRAAAEQRKRAAAEQLRIAELRQQALIWTYPESQDTMSGKPIKSARLRSSNTFNLGFPYQGVQRASLQLRKHPRFGNDVILSIEQGQFNARANARP